MDCEAVENAALSGMDLADGIVRITVLLKPEVCYRVLSEQTGLEIGDEAGLMPCIIELAKAKRAYEKIRSAMEQVEATGYGIVPSTRFGAFLEPPPKTVWTSDEHGATATGFKMAPYGVNTGSGTCS